MFQDIIGVLFALFIALLSPPTLEEPKSFLSKPISAEIVRVVDGDTIVVSIDGKDEYVRYIGIDTPEVYKNKISECFGVEATEANQNFLDGYFTVKLVSDKENKDKYNRLLRYVYVDDIFINKILIKEGYAKALPIKPNIIHAREFKNIEIEARQAQVGLWGEC